MKEEKENGWNEGGGMCELDRLVMGRERERERAHECVKGLP